MRYICLTALLCCMMAPPALADPELDKLKSDFDTAYSAWREAKQKHSAGADSDSSTQNEPPPSPTAEFAPRFRAYAESRAGTPEALDALVWLVNRGSTGDLTKPDDNPGVWAVRQITESYAGAEALKEHLPRLRYAYYDVGKPPMIQLFERVLETAKDADTRAWANFNLGFTLSQDSSIPGGEATAADKQRAAALFHKVAKEYSESPAAELAAAFIYELENLQIGMQAPEIVGTDIAGNTIKLSQFRGQVVVLDFWGFW